MATPGSPDSMRAMVCTCTPRRAAAAAWPTVLAAMSTNNLFDQATPPATGERFDELLRHKNLVIERIVSSSQITPTAYVQPQDEWVVLTQGEATLVVAGVRQVLKAGDHLFLSLIHI